VTAPDAPAAVGPYVHAIRAGGLLFCSGQIPLDPRSGDLVGATAAEQAGRCLENLGAVCQAGGARLGDAVRVTIYLTDMASFAAVNEVYGSFFEPRPGLAQILFAAVTTGLGDQGADHATVLVGFRVPLDSEHEPARGCFDGLGQVVNRRVTGDLEALGDLAHPLVVV